MARDENMIAALKRERANYVALGAEDRVEQVDASLRHYGYDPGPREDDGPQGRTAAPQQQTADPGSPAPASDVQAAVKKPAAKKPAAQPSAVPPVQ
ncbi:hypothetical protein ACFWN1_05825 [Streptomyces sp. NPDC058459]|uniref:hypothetical protein n=1 Tax=Streptomyces sp. NPDC058459 TaxID=3346508 RepID=UPI003656F246